jgi:hypothetical protein
MLPKVSINGQKGTNEEELVNGQGITSQEARRPKVGGPESAGNQRSRAGRGLMPRLVRLSPIFLKFLYF